MTGDRPPEQVRDEAESDASLTPAPWLATPAESSTNPETPFLRLLQRLETIEQERIAQDTMLDPESGAAIEPLAWAYRELEGIQQIPTANLRVQRASDGLYLLRGQRRVARLDYLAAVEEHPWRVRFFPTGGWLGWDSFSESFEDGDRALEAILAGSLQILRETQPWWQRVLGTPENRSLTLLLVILAIALAWVLRV
jgi:hypothetical protein